MKTSYLISFFLFLIEIISISCSSNKDLIKRNIEKIIDRYSSDIDYRDYDGIMFIPIDGCGSCTSESISFMINDHSKRYLYILLARDKKSISLILNEKKSKKENIIIDEFQISYVLELVGNGPAYYEVSSNNIGEPIFIDENNSSLILNSLK